MQTFIWMNFLCADGSLFGGSLYSKILAIFIRKTILKRGYGCNSIQSMRGVGRSLSVKFISLFFYKQITFRLNALIYSCLYVLRITNCREIFTKQIFKPVSRVFPCLYPCLVCFTLCKLALFVCLVRFAACSPSLRVTPSHFQA